MADALSRPTLPAIRFLANLRSDDRDILGSYGEFIPARPEVPLIAEDQPQTNVYLILTGSLSVQKKGQPIGVLKAGECFGEMTLFAPGAASATVVALEFSQLWRINQDELQQFIKDNPVAGNEILTSLLVSLSERLRQALGTA